MNYRSRALLDLAHELDCTLRIPGVCEGGRGEPCHANWAEMGKGLGQKAHDCFAVPGCRACHMELDQGSRLTKDERRRIWEAAFWRYLPKLWQRGMLVVGDMADILRAQEPETRAVRVPEMGTSVPKMGPRKGSKRGTHCTRPDKVIPRGERIV